MIVAILVEELSWNEQGADAVIGCFLESFDIFGICDEECTYKRWAIPLKTNPLLYTIEVKLTDEFSILRS